MLLGICNQLIKDFPFVIRRRVLLAGIPFEDGAAHALDIRFQIAALCGQAFSLLLLSLSADADQGSESQFGFCHHSPPFNIGLESIRFFLIQL